MELKRIWMEVKNKYQMRLAAGRKGLERQIDWVHIIEDVQVAEFLRGGELVFTTGIVGREEYLLELGKRLWKKEACGLAVNLGPYIGRVPEELLEFGDKKGFPIFTIPWEIRLVDVTRALTTRLNEYEQTEKTLNQAVENAIFRSAVPELYLPYMMRCGYPEEANYQIAVIDVERIRKDCSQSRRVLWNVREELQGMPFPVVVFWQEERLLLLFGQDSVPLCRERMERIMQMGRDRHLGFQAGVGPVVTTLPCLPRSYEHAVGALNLAKRKGEKLLNYEDFGIYKIIMDVQDRKMLDRYCREMLGPVLDYDQKKQTDYAQILREYVETGGSVREMAQNRFCHRNTIHYKLQKIRELLPVDLDDMVKRSEILLAFQILDCL